MSQHKKDNNYKNKLIKNIKHKETTITNRNINKVVPNENVVPRTNITNQILVKDY